MADDPKKAIPSPDDQTVIRGVADDEATPSKKKYAPPYLVVVDGPHVGVRFALTDTAGNIIGRAIGIAVRLDDQSVSRQHAEITKTPAGWTIKDLESKNGTFINATPIADSIVIGHKDLIKVGIYLLRLITQEIPLDVEMTLPPEYVAPDRTVFVQSPPEIQTGTMREKKSVVATVDAAAAGEALPTPASAKAAAGRRQWLLVGFLGVSVVAAAFYFGAHHFFPAKKKVVHEKTPAVQVPEMPLPPEEVGNESTPPPPSEGVALPEEAAPPPSPPPLTELGPAAPAPAAPPGAPAVPGIPVFLDFVSSPLSATVLFQDRELGHAPLRVNVELELDHHYVAKGKFVMPEIKEEFTQEVPFTVDPNKSVIPILFRGPIGMVRVDDLPRDVHFYLEGRFDYDRFREREAKLDEIVLRKPIYVPYGHYTIELKRARQLSETSQTFIQDIIYHREFVLAEESPTSVVSVHEEDLSVFPVDIRSEPPNADVFIDGSKVGKTPYSGVFPLGEHRLSLRKDGYFEHSEALKVDINTPYATVIPLKTSVAGAHINNARAAINRAMTQEAINELAEALAGQPTAAESALANELLGQAYFKQGDVDRAFGYFQKAREHEEQRYPATLGIINCYAVKGQMNDALPLLVEVLLKGETEDVKREAHELFQKISPFRSVLYVYSEPAGATVTVNDKAVATPTPVIISQLSLGNYKIHIEKAGYLPSDLNITVSVNDFNPVIVKLKPIPR